MRKKLLLADDSITIQKVVELTFPSDEFEVVTAGNGRVAVDKAMTFLPDIVLCDVIMPQLDGYQVCEALRASDQLKNVPILLLNGAFEPYDAERAKAVGALGNVSKPFDPPALVARVKEILSERSTAAIERPTQPMSLEAITAIAKEHDEAKAKEESITAASAESHAYTYEESETHPVSTVEVPMGVRELAARSLSLDAPVFAVPEPEVLTTEAEPDLSDTLHGPLDDAPPVQEAAPIETIDEIESIEEIEHVAPTGEFEIPKPAAAAAPAEEMPSSEPVEFDPAPADELPQTLPPVPPPPVPAVSVAVAPVIEEFSGEHEFEPDDLSTPVNAAATEPMALPEELAAPEPMAVPLPAPAPAAVAEPVISLPPPAPRPTPPVAAPAPWPAPPVALPAPPEPPKAAPPVVPVVPAESGVFAGLPDFVEPAPQTPPTAGLPSAEVAVPVDMVQQIAQRVISQVSERVIREIAWDVIPGLAEKLIKAEIERIKARAESESD